MQNPVVPYHFCLLIPCYNHTEGLLQSLGSVQYDPSLYCIVVVDDGSRIPLEKASIAALWPQPPEIVVIKNSSNAGITVSLNKGLDYIKQHIPARYIARLDAGDTCVPDRFVHQVQYLAAYPEVVLLGSWCRFYEPGGKKEYTYTAATTDAAIRKQMHSRCSFIHPGVMFRKELLEKQLHYPNNFPHAEDYAFFWELLKWGEGAILPLVLTHCTINPRGISLKNRRAQLNSRLRIVRRYGTNPGLQLAGILRIWLLLALPYSLILFLKKKNTSKLS